MLFATATTTTKANKGNNKNKKLKKKQQHQKFGTIYFIVFIWDYIMGFFKSFFYVTQILVLLFVFGCRSFWPLFLDLALFFRVYLLVRYKSI